MEQIWPRLTAQTLASQRLDLEPLRVGHATEAAVVFDPAVGPVGTYSGQIELGANS